MRRSLLTLALLFAACDSRPELSLCEQVQSCEYAQLVVNEDVCAEQVQAVLRDQGPDCLRCVTGLKCMAIEGVLRGTDKIRSLCSSCGESIDVPTVEAGGTLFLTPAIVKKDKAPEATPQNDELLAQSEALCAQGEECEGAQLLLNVPECVRQVSGVLVTRDPECRLCASSLSCPGVLAVIRGEQQLSGLCSTCGVFVDARGVGPVGPGGPYLLIPGFVAVPPPPPPDAAAADSEQAPPAPAPASAATVTPAAPTAPAPVAPTVPPVPVATLSPARASTDSVTAPGSSPLLPREISREK